MKRYFAWFAVAVVGAAVGASVMGSFCMHSLRAVIPSHIRTLEERQEYTCMLSLGVLNRLETGDNDGAKSLLAREVANYYYHPWQADAPQRAMVLQFIETTKPNSSVLREELSKNSP